MFEGVPVEGWIGIGAFIAILLILAMIHGISDAVRSAQETRREAAEVLKTLNKLVESTRKGPPPSPRKAEIASQRPVKPRRVVRHSGAAGGGQAHKPGYGPRSAAR